MKFFFELVNDVVHLDARLEDGDTIGDARVELREGEEFFGVSYDQMREAGSGIIFVDTKNEGHLFEDEDGLPDEDGGNF